MGDRSNIFIQQVRRADELGEEGPGPRWSGIGIYSHWGGAELHQVALRVLQQPNRVGDAPYFTRVFVQRVLEGMQVQSSTTTGSGLWCDALGPCDNSHPILVVNAETGRAWYVPAGREDMVFADEPKRLEAETTIANEAAAAAAEVEGGAR